MVKAQEIFLLQAISEAWEVQTLALPNPSVGALILSKDFEILALEAHERFGSSHAELLAFKSAFLKLNADVKKEVLDSLSPKELWDFLAKNHGGVFKECSVFVTLEPCLHEGKTPSCAKLLSILHPKCVVFGASDPTSQAKGGAEFLSSCGIEVLGGVCLQQSLDLLYPFMTYVHKGRFNLFKIAQRLNGDYKRGQISNMASRIFTHTQRSNADSIVISGNTVRTDSPKLDTRFSRIQNKTPKIQILTQTFTPTDCICANDIRLYNHVDDLQLEEGFNLIEGGYPLLSVLRNKIDGLLLIVAPKFGGSNPTKAPDMNFDLLYAQEFCEASRDIALWLKPKDLL
ncbi:bifunctional diaminohydroxyphosphoribosylaminopyrimidine deaminase/5-amino-6-(5-phosphoribosylamino)uracil reductase RibD [Helicobacter kayseriensis]|uniref:bifunctional diaminohydroxyphosphoribosylaminopyrimidine deaminase/5-amino-6-(5-phosphoribosylamino)uracil reductase RibD n=1 Tax=Helicobacter kayseriensis TaxID=2905877 RepID=UPI001E4C6856|nr:bifunctional diaminohydroxyphosphoribosylaminopyrimidine deaminase/5-amino-6-(5-phosphoribosylamino)uracil reductase RibD [Helicobacter kayseriensis]MCE3047168.1 bifunctional diaminohydroxyphosphoribosylaminopyrimidine deaminase/5-amino-6-(5-phosphoribosylamino)uracil reductase RibD [Helicobacter kayseriensis]MCE3048539.1 bifunctional diaminohydroxyphosphoribosylaminopyrimidine deaminase/5-amino-6-(5-phosphoribosylamino)uracil reductase RibD [Helicobacter kayseriensis]